MSLLGSNMAPGVRSELCRRSKIIPDGYGPWTHARIPWIRLSPCVHVNDSESTRKNHIIYGGKLDDLSSTYLTNTTHRFGPESSKYMDPRRTSGGSKRNNPKPGIKSLDVEEKGTLGGIKKAKINFVIWDKETLAEYERSYFCLGKHALIEWGWNIDTKGDLVTTNLGNSESEVSVTDSAFSCRVRTAQNQHRYSYDAVRGLITNFNWSINEFGGFDCTLELTSKGTTFLSTPTETATMHSDCDEDPDNAAKGKDKVHRPNIEQPLYFLKQSLKTTHANQEPLRNTNTGKPAIGMAAKFDKELSTGDWIASLFAFNGPTNAELEFYITWDYFEEYIVNRKLAPMYDAYGKAKANKDQETSTTDPGEDKCTNKISTKPHPNPQVFKQAYDRTKGFIDEQPRTASRLYNFDSRGTIVRNSAFLMSADPSKAMLPRQEHWRLHPASVSGWGEFKAWISGITAYAGTYLYSYFDNMSLEWTKYSALGMSINVPTGINTNPAQATKDAQQAQQDAIDASLAKSSKAANVDAATDKTLLGFKAFDWKYSKGSSKSPGQSGEGLLSNLLINVAFIEETSNEAKSLDDFMDTILNGISESCGGIWDLMIVEDPDNAQILRVIDRNMTRKSEDVFGFHFQAMGRKSICRDLSIETDIDSKMAAMVMYGSNKSEIEAGKRVGQPMGGASANEYTLWGNGVKDLVAQGIVLPDSGNQEQDIDCCGTGVATNENALDDAWQGYYVAAEDVADKVDEDSVEGMITAMRKLLAMADPNQGLPTAEDADPPVLAYTGGDELITVPVKISMTIDGIAGLRWGNFIGFTVDSAFPSRYTSIPKGGKSFQIVGVDQVIDQGDWQTKLRLLMRPGACIGSGLTDCSTNQGKLPTEIMPSTETITRDLIPFDIPPPVLKKDEDKDDDEFIKLERIPIKTIPNEIPPPEPVTAGCPCEDGSYHEDCCEEPIPSDEPIKNPHGEPPPTVTPNPKEGCQCPDGSFNQSCCEKEPPNIGGDGGDGHCEDPIPEKDPGTVTIIETKESVEPDIVIEDHVIEEDCDGWNKRGSILYSGNIVAHIGPWFKDVWYYEFRAHQEHCYFIDLYLWHGKDSSNNGIDSKAMFHSMRPPSGNSVNTLFGEQSKFSAATLNRTATLEQAIAAYQRSYSRIDKRKAKKNLKNSRGVSSRFGYNKSEFGRKEKGFTQNMLIPGSRKSGGLWTSQQIQWFRDDQPFEVNQPAIPGTGGPEEFGKWNKEGSTHSVLYHRNAATKGFCERWLKWQFFVSASAGWKTIVANFHNFASNTLGFRNGRWTNSSHTFSNTFDNPDLIKLSYWKNRPFGWNDEIGWEQMANLYEASDDGRSIKRVTGGAGKGREGVNVFVPEAARNLNGRFDARSDLGNHHAGNF